MKNIKTDFYLVHPATAHSLTAQTCLPRIDWTQAYGVVRTKQSIEAVLSAAWHGWAQPASEEKGHFALVYRGGVIHFSYPGLLALLDE